MRSFQVSEFGFQKYLPEGEAFRDGAESLNRFLRNRAIASPPPCHPEEANTVCDRRIFPPGLYKGFFADAQNDGDGALPSPRPSDAPPPEGEASGMVQA